MTLPASSTGLMRPLARIAIVAGGYIAAALAASAVVAIRIASTSGPEAQASSGMYAFGDAVLFVAVFGVCALVPTGAALLFLRPYPRFWTLLATVALFVAVTGVIGVILYAAGRQATTSPLATWAQVSVLRILIAPLLALTFTVCGALSPFRTQQLALLAAAALELAVSLYAGVVWFLPLLVR